MTLWKLILTVAAATTPATALNLGLRRAPNNPPNSGGSKVTDSPVVPAAISGDDAQGTGNHLQPEDTNTELEMIRVDDHRDLEAAAASAGLSARDLQELEHYHDPHADHPILGPLTGWLDDVKFIIFLIVLVIFDIMALNFEILHAVDWLQHKDHINKVVDVAAGFSMTILSIFTIEVTLRMARNTKKFFKKKFNIVDMAIVYISVVLEIILLAVPKSTWCGDDDGHHNSSSISSHRRVLAAGSDDGHGDDCTVENYKGYGAAVLALIIIFRLGRVVHAFHEMMELGDELDDASDKASLDDELERRASPEFQEAANQVVSKSNEGKHSAVVDPLHGESEHKHDGLHQDGAVRHMDTESALEATVSPGVGDGGITQRQVRMSGPIGASGTESAI